eukprot:CAMPEP_0170615592 /NCGR_PEP_ID=MMETSP0224-20130122/25421_1 /TAXON_ID=285029 /ORGANISM="Togula jolla, Strain CCCM 725" /LENGTH=41 /DNA_ID= /DNA_START= /DNA_END= /DNA_ORIENTATION=
MARWYDDFLQNEAVMAIPDRVTHQEGFASSAIIEVGVDAAV